ncbi:MAG: type II secretion system F family protein [Selenomonadaceae bacterium]|nr:type II secretion system F family protein [Selenomonadaceae bacterium]
MNTALLVIALVAVLGVLLLAFFVWQYGQKRQVDVLRRVLPYMVEEEKEEAENRVKADALAFARKYGTPLASIRPTVTLDRRMEQAGIPLFGWEYIVLVLAATVILCGLTALLTLDIATVAVVALAGLFGGWFFIGWRIKRRYKQFTNQLSDCLITVSNALRAGFSFLQAMDLVAKEMEPPLGEEFSRVMREVSVGKNMEDALKDMDARVQSADFSLVVTAVLIQREVGGNLAEILDNISATINERIRMRREILTLTTQGRASMWILLIFPAALCGVLSLISPGYMDPMLESTAGRIALVVCAVMEFIGYIVIRRIIDIKM